MILIRTENRDITAFQREEVLDLWLLSNMLSVWSASMGDFSISPIEARTAAQTLNPDSHRVEEITEATEMVDVKLSSDSDEPLINKNLAKPNLPLKSRVATLVSRTSSIPDLEAPITRGQFGQAQYSVPSSIGGNLFAGTSGQTTEAGLERVEIASSFSTSAV
jgi:hypothetical protein